MRNAFLLLLLLYNYSTYAQSRAFHHDATVPNHYFGYSLKLIKETPGFTPPVAARAFGYMGIALYEAVVPGIPDHTSAQGKLFELNKVTLPVKGADYDWPTVANNALAGIMDSLFRTMTHANKDSLNAIRTLYNDLAELELTPQVFQDSKAFGEAIAKDILDYSRLDGGHNAFAENFPPSYVPPVGEEYWVPFGNQVCMQPYWGSHRPFIHADTTTETTSQPPPSFSTDPGSSFYGYANQVYTTGINLTDEQKTIASYWGDGAGSITPAGHSISMLRNILISEHADLEEAVVAYAKLGIALSDAFLACWKTKYIYNLCRPVTYIQSHIDTAWLPFIPTPPFPEYSSGHSSQSGAMAEVMTNLFGDNFAFTDSTHGANFGGPRLFISFDEAAGEAAISRLYGGIHYEFSNNAGLALGRIVGENVNALFDEMEVATEDVTSIIPTLHVYPNPTTDYLLIQSEADLSGAPYLIYDNTGSVLLTGVLSSQKTEIAVNTLPAGLFFVVVDQAKTYRFVKS